MPDSTEMILRLLLAALLGSAVGLERERLLWVAGLRTHMLVCVGSALFMLVSAFGFAGALGPRHVELDVSRVAAQVVSGIGFLGAGTILLRHDVIRGLTTAASLWTVAAIGLAVGGGLYVPAGAATALILIILAVLKPIEKKLYIHRRMRRFLFVEIEPEKISRAAVEAVVSLGNVQVEQSEAVGDPGPTGQSYQFIVTADSADDLERLAGTIRALKGVRNASLGLIR